MLAGDFFPVDMVAGRLYGPFFMEIDTRRMYVTGVTANPVGEWVTQPARNLSFVLAERFAGAVRRECLYRILVFHCRQLEQVLAEFVAHDNGHRPHRSLAQHAPLGVSKRPLRINDPDPAQLGRSDILGGLVNEYRLVA